MLKLIFILLIKSKFFNLKKYSFQGFTGIDQPYEKPTNPEVKIILKISEHSLLCILYSLFLKIQT